MEKLGYGREQVGKDFVYRDVRGQVALAVNEKNEMRDHDGGSFAGIVLKPSCT